MVVDFFSRLPKTGTWLLELVTPFMESVSDVVPGEVFPYYFTMEMFQRAILAVIVVTVLASAFGCFLLIRNMALIGDGLAHVSFGGVAVYIVLAALGSSFAEINDGHRVYALLFACLAALIIDEMKSRGLLEGDTAIAIMMTGFLGMGLVLMRIYGAPLLQIEGYLFGNILLVDGRSLNFIVNVALLCLLSLALLGRSLLASAIDPVGARVQGIPVRNIGRLFSILTALVVVSMVDVMGVLLVTALLVTPAATGQLVGWSFRSCLVWAQVFGFLSVGLGLYYSAERGTGTGEMIALVSAIIFCTVALFHTLRKSLFQAKRNLN